MGQQGECRIGGGDLGLAQVDQVLTVGWHQLAGPTDRPQVVLLQQCRRLLETVGENLGGLELGEVVPPLILPMQGQGAQSQHGETQSSQGPRGGAMQLGQPRRLTLDPPSRERPMDDLQGGFGAP